MSVMPFRLLKSRKGINDTDFICSIGLGFFEFAPEATGLELPGQELMEGFDPHSTNLCFFSPR